MSDYAVGITGLGVVSPIGNEPQLYWQRLEEAESGVSPLTRFTADRFRSHLAAEVDQFSVEMIESETFRHQIKRMDRFVQYALYASQCAIEESQESVEKGASEGGIFIGVGMGGLPNMESGVIVQESKGPRRTNPYLIPSLIPNMAASMIAMNNRFGGLQNTFAGACAGGLQAIGQAYELIRTGRLKWAVAGGVEAVVTPITFSGFEAMRALSTSGDPDTVPRPFDRERDGMIVGEGAAIFFLEELGRAEHRGVSVYGQIKSYSSNSSYLSLVQPDTTALLKCMELATVEQGMPTSELQAIFSSGSGLRNGDEAEMEAYRQLLAEEQTAPYITSVKGSVGHTFAASGPLSMLAAIGALQQNRIPGIRNLQQIDEKFGKLNFLTQVTEAMVENCLINAFGFGGINASLVVSSV